MASFGILCLTLIGVITTTVIRGYVLTVLWAWFVVPIFAAPTLRIPYAIGLSTIAGMLTLHSRPNEQDGTPEEKAIRAVFFSALCSLLALAIGWIVQLFI